MKLNIRFLFIFISLIISVRVIGQNFEIEVAKLMPFIQALEDFSENLPHEKVYLHFDNTSYYHGDKIWFKCYVVTSAQRQLSLLSKTLYVELLNPGGEIVDRRILKIEDGQCHGDFSLNQLPFYSGFYEVRAYTKYMLNFGDEVIFSRLLPVFSNPKEEGNFEEKEMLSYSRWGVGNYPMKRERPLNERAVNIRFFPEGGNLIQGVASRIAFEATDEFGNPIDVTGIAIDGARQEFSTFREGRGIFAYTPPLTVGRRSPRPMVEVEYAGRKYQFDLPSSLPLGVVMEVDNLSHPDSIEIFLRKNSNTPAEILGVAVLSGGELQYAYYAWIEDGEISLKIDKTLLPWGVSQIALFNSKGEILCDRLVFAGINETFDVNVKTDKPVYYPFELVEMEISLTDIAANPVNATFSLSVRDGSNEVESRNNILSDLLLMSEIKGYVSNPLWYFEDGDDTRLAALDLLLMVQGWRRYSWKQMAGVEPYEIKYPPEKGIETHGRIVSLVRQRPQPNVDVALYLNQRKEGDDSGSIFVESFVTDNMGKFSFMSDVDGRWNMILTVSENGRKKDHRILLDRIFSPQPRRYSYAEMQVNIAENNIETDDETFDQFNEEFEAFLAAYRDSIAKLNIEEKVHQLSAVTVRARRSSPAQSILQNRSTSVAYYDVASEKDDIYDSGKYIGDDIHDLLKNMNNNFFAVRRGNHEFMYYKQNKMTLFVVNYQRVEWSEMGYFKYRQIRLGAIKSIYINEGFSAIAQYIYQPNPQGPTAYDIAHGISCVVFIETYPEGQIPSDAAKGVRRTWLEGYSAVNEFYSPNYSLLPPSPNDYRRTLYWNPSVATDENGKAKIHFYNNSRCTNFSISAETVTSQGVIGIYSSN